LSAPYASSGSAYSDQSALSSYHLLEVEHGRGVQRERVGPVELEARELHRVHVVRHVVGHRLEDRSPDVAHSRGFVSGGEQDRLEHLRGRRLAVGAGDGQPRYDPIRVLEPPRQLDVAPHGDAPTYGVHQQG
jgi:hypothetical protein